MAKTNDVIDSNYNQPSDNEHAKITQYLKKEFVDYINNLDEIIFKQSACSKKEIIDFVRVLPDCLNKTREQVAALLIDTKKNTPKDDSTITRKVHELNSLLLEFCIGNGVSPPIQLFSFYINKKEERRKRSNFFLACSVPMEEHSNTATDILLFDRVIRKSKWIQIYKENLFDSSYVSTQWITLTGLEVDRKKSWDAKGLQNGGPLGIIHPGTDKYIGEPATLFDMVKHSKNILLTGNAGAGKTTAMKLLQNLLVDSNEMDGLGMPVYIDLKKHEKFMDSSLDKLNDIQMPQLVGQAIALTLYQKLRSDKLKKCDIIQALIQEQHLSEEQVFDHIAMETSAWFENKKAMDDNFIFLIDGMNEINARVRNAVSKEINRMEHTPCKFVVACRSNIAGAIRESLNQACEYELQELNEDQMIRCLDHYFPGHGQSFFSEKIAGDERILSMVKTPFFLSLAVQSSIGKDEFTIPTNRAELIRSFVVDCIKRTPDNQTLKPENMTRELLFVILPRVAKWSIDSATQDNEAGTRPFHASRDFLDASGSRVETLTALKVAQDCGLLISSGLILESSDQTEHPEFVHDNIRDFFAALYLQSLSHSELITEIPKMLEFFMWDESLLQLLELNEDVRLFKEMVRLIIPIDVVLAALCVAYAKIREGQEGICLPLLREISEAENSKMIEQSLPHSLLQKWYPRTCFHKLSITILTRFSAEFLVNLKKKLPSGTSLSSLWSAVALTPQRDLAFFKDLWDSLHEDTAKCSAFWGICRIPTYQAFKTATGIYNDLRNEDSSNWGTLGQFMFSDCSCLTLISYCPSLKELAAEFPREEYPEEFKTLLSKVERVDPDDVSLLEELISSQDPSMVSSILFGSGILHVCKLLVKLQGSNAISTLMNGLNIAIQTPLLFSNDRSLCFKRIFEIIIELDRNEAMEMLLLRLMVEDRYSDDITLWELNSIICTRDSIGYFVKYAFKKLRGRLCEINSIMRTHVSVLYFAIDQIEAWPNPQDAVEEFNDCREGGNSVPDEVKLLGVFVKEDLYLSDVLNIFDNICARVIDEVRNTPPDLSFPQRFLDLLKKNADKKDAAPETLHFYKSILEGEDKREARWHEQDFEHNMKLFPLGIRALRCIRVDDTQLISRLLNVIQWAHTKLLEGEDKSPSSKFPEEKEVLIEVITQCLRSIAHILHDARDIRSIQEYLEADIFKDLLILLLIREDARKQDYSRLRSGLMCFITSLPTECAKALLSKVMEVYEHQLEIRLAGKDVHLELVSEIILLLCQGFENALVYEVLQSLSAMGKDKKDSDLIRLIQEIKVSKGRRFLSAVSGNYRG